MNAIDWFGLLKLALLPPSVLFILIFIGALVSLRYVKVGRAVAIIAFALLVVLSTPFTGRLLLSQLTNVEPLLPGGPVRQNAAIVILGGDVTGNLEYGGETVGRLTLERLRYGARLQRQLDLPVLVTGGALGPGQPALGTLMAEALQDDFGVAARWRETGSRNTYENAVNSSRMLQKDGVRSVYLVTHALHMRRAQEAFAATGLEVIPAPVGVYGPKYRWTPRDIVPSAYGLAASAAAVYELLGRIWYRFHYL